MGCGFAVRVMIRVGCWWTWRWAIADGAETISDVQALADQPGLHGPVASTRSGGYWTVWTPTCWMSFGWACLMVCVRGCPDSETGWSWEGALNGRDDR